MKRKQRNNSILQQKIRAVLSGQDVQDQSTLEKGKMIVLAAQCLKAICIVLIAFIYPPKSV